ncbi:uncharacterized protein (DUF2141 family) [Sphingobium sp. OAS761]|uniref:DUF2141 domain-containing protein n=1 Tax=Sphingobium sp. OAS761 TaxID=2817901 RepID=UPI00209EB47C|nr:DUF2141 domain-containing protein [Sphingobium sp. OAS761]MCP1470743.1 uncharacterized protein (DUF2141 family) [Sphingobium sp. OAS761]
MLAAWFILAAAAIESTPDLGTSQGQCRPNETGAAFLVEVIGFKDRRGRIKLELYPANDRDFLADDNVLLNAGKAFARVDMAVPRSGPVELCIRAPGPGLYALSLLHDRNGDRKFNLSGDGVGFPGDPKLGWSKPRAAVAAARVGTMPRRLTITLQYRRGLFSFGPEKP